MTMQHKKPSSQNMSRVLTAAGKHGRTFMAALQRTRVREVSGMALAAASRSAMVKPFCKIRHDSRFARLLQRPSVHHGIVQTGRMLQCPS